MCEGCLTRITNANATYWDDHETVLVRGVARVVLRQTPESADDARPAHEPTSAG